MRQRFVQALTELMTRDESVFVLTADTGFHVLDDLRERHADRCLNVGIAEAAMISMAAGLAREGPAGRRRRVFVYGIAPFVTFRCYEQIRVDLCYANLPVTIVGVGGGLTYGPSGMTHHAIEDIAAMCALPNMTVLCPGDPFEAAAAVAGLAEVSGPAYLRLGKSNEPTVHPGPIAGFHVGKSLRLRGGGDLAIIATGNMLATACDVADRLAPQGLAADVLSMHTVKPIDAAAICEAATRCGWLVTIEEHKPDRRAGQPGRRDAVRPLSRRGMAASALRHPRLLRGRGGKSAVSEAAIRPDRGADSRGYSRRFPPHGACRRRRKKRDSPQWVIRSPSSWRRSNEAGHLAATIGEVLAAVEGLFAECEILIIDDSSSDGTGRVADQLAAGQCPKNARIRAFHSRRNHGLGWVFRAGLRLARMDYVILVNGKHDMAAAQMRKILTARGRTDLVVPVSHEPGRAAAAPPAHFADLHHAAEPDVRLPDRLLQRLRAAPPAGAAVAAAADRQLRVCRGGVGQEHPRRVQLRPGADPQHLPARVQNQGVSLEERRRRGPGPRLGVRRRLFEQARGVSR